MVNSAAAPAKVNLTLHVTGRRADGYHLLDSLVAFAGVGDRISVRPASDLSLSVAGPEAAEVPRDENNLVLKAARFMGVGDAAITLHKDLPVASGIGGGSSDAAATLKALAWMCGQPIPAGTEALGADVPVCLAAKASRMRGIGENVETVPSLPPVWCVLVNPRAALSTAAVFGALGRRDNPPMPDEIPSFGAAQDLALWLSGQRNDLEDPAVSCEPAIGPVLAALSAIPGCLLARMSGSGATCFGLFEDETRARDAAAAISRENPKWWVRAAALS